MRPLRECPASILTNVQGVLADIDDTLTSDGRLTAEAYTAMEQIHTAGLTLIPVTGRPAGWCDHIARMWPVDAVVGENGAFWFRYDHASRRMERRYVQGAEQRRDQRERLRAISDDVLHHVPRASVAADQHYREADLAIDFCEDIPRLTDREINTIVDVMRAHGLSVKVSSIHVNGWFGSYDKLTTTRELLDALLGRQHGARTQFCFIGDSPNDEPMFAYFECSVGVANVLDFADRIRHWPRYITEGRGGAGFAQFAHHLVRSACSNQRGEKS